MTFAAPNKPGKVVKKIRIETDLGKNLTLEVVAQAEVTGPPAKRRPTDTPIRSPIPPIRRRKHAPGSGPRRGQCDQARFRATAHPRTASTTSNTHFGQRRRIRCPDAVHSVRSLRPTSVMPNPIRSAIH